LHFAAVIPVRNRSSLVVDAIASVQRQTRPLDEIIVVDDGSSDATPETVARLSRQDSRIRLVPLLKSGGASAARNAGINASQCEWISFLDSDDQWMTCKHEMQMNALANRPQAIASFTGIRYQFRERYDDVPAPSTITLQALRRLNYLGSTSTAMVQRHALRQIGGFDPTLPSCQDWDLWIKLRRIGDFAIVRDPLVLFNQTEQDRITRNKAGVLTGNSRLFARALDGVTDNEERRIIAAHHQVRLAQIHLWDFKEPIPALAAAVKSLRLHRTEYGVHLLRAALRDILRRLLYRKTQTKD
jgi:glycosyltransferase involved in cell wall biosynthesis